jgi:hypothetical protein
MKWFNFITTALPGIIQLILSAEAALGPGTGAAKAQMVVGSIIPPTSTQTLDMPDPVLLGHAVDNIVASMNKAGLLGKTKVG